MPTKPVRAAKLCALLGALGLVASIWFGSNWLTSLQGDWPRAQRITCRNNLQHIATALRMWAMDNQDQYPFALSTNAGGTLEYCARDGHGYDSNAFLHFMVASNELSTPRALVCPQDHPKHAAPSFAQLRPQNVSYQLCTGTNVSYARPQETVAVCPVHGTALQVDGSLINEKAEPEPWWWPYEDLLDYEPGLRLSLMCILGLLGCSVLLLGLALLLYRRSLGSRA